MSIQYLSISESCAISCGDKIEELLEQVDKAVDELAVSSEVTIFMASMIKIIKNQIK